MNWNNLFKATLFTLIGALMFLQVDWLYGQAFGEPLTAPLTDPLTSPAVLASIDNPVSTHNPAPYIPDHSCKESRPKSAPRIISAKLTGTNQITLVWEKAQGSVSYYFVSYGTKPGVVQYGNPNVGGANTTSYVIKNLGAATTYYFKVRAGNGCMPGEASNEVSVNTSGAIRSDIVPSEFSSLGVATVQARLNPTVTQLEATQVTEEKSVTSPITKLFNKIVNLFNGLIRR